MKEIIAIKINKRDAERIIQKIKKENNFNSDYKIEKDKDNIYIPVKKIPKELNKYKTTIKNPQKQKKIGLSLKKLISKEIPKKYLKEIPTSYDIVGDIIIINLTNKDFAKKYSSKIGKALIKIHPHIKVILNKEKEHHGTFRTQDLMHLYGENRKETTIIENRCFLKTNVEKVFFSTRLVNERKRIAKQIKKNEIVGVFFAGVGPFAIEILKISNNKPKEIIAIELNPIGYKYLIENIKLNKMEKKIKAINGDVKQIYLKYPKYFDRICMPLPKSSEDFLDNAIFSIKNKGIVHIYNFVSKNKPYEEINKIIKKKEIKYNCKIKIKNKKIIRSFSATKVQIVMDLKIIF